MTIMVAMMVVMIGDGWKKGARESWVWSSSCCNKQAVCVKTTLVTTHECIRIESGRDDAHLRLPEIGARCLSKTCLRDEMP